MSKGPFSYIMAQRAASNGKSNYVFYCSMDAALHAQIQKGEGSRPPTLKNHIIIGYLSNACPDPLANHEATGTSLSGQHLNGASLAGQWWPDYNGIWILPHPPSSTKKFHVKIGPPLTKLSGYAHVLTTHNIGLCSVKATLQCIWFYSF